MRLVLLAALLLGSSSSLHAGVVYVDGTATGLGDGSSWSNAETSLRVALDGASAGDELWVAAGTYLPGQTAAEADSFFLKNQVALLGGFAGGETSASQRDWVANPTYLSGDIGQDDILAGWPSSWNIQSSNSAHVVTALGVDSSAVLDGFFVAHGHTGPSGTPAGSSSMTGSGLYNVDSDPIVRNCVFEYHVSAWATGAAMANYDSSPTLSNCTFRYNIAHLSNGAGISILGSSAPVIRDCWFNSNHATAFSGGGQGGAISTDWSSPPITIDRCTFVGNKARQWASTGAGSGLARGGAISSFSAGLLVRDCVFEDNSGNAGGAIYTWGNAAIVNSIFLENKVNNVATSFGSLSSYASAIGATTGFGEHIVVDNCAVVSNTVIDGEGGAVVCFGDGSLLIANSILWGNSAPTPASPRQVHYKGAIELTHNCIENLFVPHFDDPVPQASEIPGCIDLDPQFVSASSDLHLVIGSPCIDAGDNAQLLGSANTDLDGFDRVALGATSLVVDMGPYEFGSGPQAPCPTLISQPASESVTAGQLASFSVFAHGPELDFQWRRNGVLLSDGAGVVGATSFALTLNSTTMADAGSYDVVVGNSCTSVISSAATLMVDPAPLGSVVCSADGTDPGCPCGNDKDEGEGCENSTGDGGRLVGSGSASIAAGDAVLVADQLPTNQPGIFFMGSNLLNGGVGVAFGDGLRCTGAIKRFSVQGSGGSGTMTLVDPASQAPSLISAGSTRIFQAWFRDPTGPCGSGWNTSNAYQISFLP